MEEENKNGAGFTYRAPFRGNGLAPALYVSVFGFLASARQLVLRPTISTSNFVTTGHAFVTEFASAVFVFAVLGLDIHSRKLLVSSVMNHVIEGAVDQVVFGLVLIIDGNVAFWITVRRSRLCQRVV